MSIASSTVMSLARIAAIVGMLLSAALPAGAQPAPGVEEGYRLMYDLRFEQADRHFADLERANPGDPLMPASRAANVLFRELDRLHVLQTELFRDDATFKSGAAMSWDPHVRDSFQALVNQTTRLADERLKHYPRDANALFARTLTYGLQSDYASLIEHRNMAALSLTRTAARSANELLAVAPDYYDAYLATGMNAYVVGSLPGPLRLLLRMGGYTGDKEGGIRQVTLTAERGRLLAPFARVLLAVASLRYHDEARARTLLSGLAREFPSNPLFARELHRLDGHS